jgi:cytochrome c1
MLKWLAMILMIIVLAACGREIGRTEKFVNGDAAAGRAAIIAYGCGACHSINGIPNATTFVGPPLNKYEQRHYIAGNLPNTTDNLIYWIQFPQSVEPGTAMPNLNVTEADARNIVAYLYSQ